MTPAQWLSIRSLFEKALDLPPAERAAMLQAHPDRAIVLSVERMLDEHASADTLLDQSLGVLTPTGFFRPQPGDVLCGRFRIERQAGRGGMGVVYQALDLYLDCSVALKVIEFTASNQASNQDEWTRFKREIHLARSIAHAHVCRVFDLHLHRQGGRETPLLAMEFVPGPTAAEWLAQNGPMPPDQVLSVLRDVAGALDAAHARGVVHRDLKPSNVILATVHSGKDRAVVTDFGLARQVAVQEQTLPGAPVSHATIIGTPSYMSPEQFTGATPTAAMDVYALGALAYELLLARPAYEPGNPVEIALRKADPPTLRLSDIPPTWRSAILRALDPQPERRFPSAGAFVEALTRPRHTRRTWLLASTAATVAASAGAAYLLTRVKPIPEAALALIGQGQDSLLCGMAWRAMKQFEQALLLAPDMPGTRAWLAWSWLHLDQPERARTLLGNSLSGTPVGAVVKALLALDAKAALRAAAPSHAVASVLHFYLEDSQSAAQAIRQGSPPLEVALARATRHEHDLNNAGFNAERTGHAEQAWQMKLLLASFKLPRATDQDASQIFLQIRQAAQKFANPEMLIRCLGLESAREWLTGSEARGAELALEIETQAQSAQAPYLAAIVLADLTDRLYGAGRVLDADFYSQRAHAIGYPVQAFASCGHVGMFNARTLRYEGDERRSVQSREGALQLLARSGNPALYARLTSATR